MILQIDKAPVFNLGIDTVYCGSFSLRSVNRCI